MEKAEGATRKSGKLEILDLLKNAKNEFRPFWNKNLHNHVQTNIPHVDMVKYVISCSSPVHTCIESNFC